MSWLAWRRRPLLAQEVHDLRVGLEDLLAGEVLDLVDEAARLVDRAVDVEPVADAGQVVVPAVAGAVWTTPVPVSRVT